jgi:hypothetical protein
LDELQYSKNNGSLVQDFTDKRINNTHASKFSEELKLKIKNALISRLGRITNRGISSIVGLPLTTVFRYLKLMGVKNRSSPVKPLLTNDQKIRRMKFVISQLDNSGTKFKSFENTVHVDESWFFVSKLVDRVKSIPGELEFEVQKTRHKSHRVKVMFVTAVGLWRVAANTTAKNKSKNRAKNEIYLKDCTVTAEWYRECMVGKGGIMEAINSKL